MFTSIQIINLTYLPDSVHFVKNWTYGNFRYAHTLYQENNYLYLCGGDVNSNAGLTIIDITQPENPVKRGEYTRAFVHDCYVRNDTIYAAVTGINKYVIMDATNKDSIREIAEINNLAGYQLPHSCWLSDDGNFLFTTDESRGPAGIVQVWDIHNLSNIQFVSTVRPPNDNSSIAHNVFINKDVLYVSHHTAGLRLFDIRNPFNISEFAYHDTYPASNQTIIAGNWGTFPFFKSKKIISSDMQTGLYVHSIISDPTHINTVNTTIYDYNLFQNYPNPFNPKTIINYQCLMFNYVSLKVYDALGKEVATLVNEKQSAGNYSVEFDGSNYPSGIYFYRLVIDSYVETENFSETRRMILLK